MGGLQLTTIALATLACADLSAVWLVANGLIPWGHKGSGSHVAQHTPCMASRGACIEALAAIGVHMPILEHDKDVQMVRGGRWQVCACVGRPRRAAGVMRAPPSPASCMPYKRTGLGLSHERAVHPTLP